MRKTFKEFKKLYDESVENKLALNARRREALTKSESTRLSNSRMVENIKRLAKVRVLECGHIPKCFCFV